MESYYFICLDFNSRWFLLISLLPSIHRLRYPSQITVFSDIQYHQICLHFQHNTSLRILLIFQQEVFNLIVGIKIGLFTINSFISSSTTGSTVHAYSLIILCLQKLGTRCTSLHLCLSSRSHHHSYIICWMVDNHMYSASSKRLSMSKDYTNRPWIWERLIDYQHWVWLWCCSRQLFFSKTIFCNHKFQFWWCSTDSTLSVPTTLSYLD